MHLQSVILPTAVRYATQYDLDLNFVQSLPTEYPSSWPKSKKEGKDQESIQSSTTPDPGYQWESDNFTKRQHKRGPRGQTFPSR